ncbi:hypothetical protein [Flavobacterium rhizosphaerae]|uniref:Response regulatory domain-containing protein n=1 Tax=Flavobacterium rhizosphaerae TaxID=3163298 RepID=A0ABW8YV78_9FLAO
MQHKTFVYIIDIESSNRKKYIDTINKTYPNVIKNTFPSVKEAVDLVKIDVIAAPDYIFISQNAFLKSTQAQLRGLRTLKKCRKIKIILFGTSISREITAKAKEYDGRILNFASNENLLIKEISDKVKRLYN